MWDYQSVGSGSENPASVQAYMNSSWLNANIKTGHSSLGAYYPQSFVSEGDSPAFLHLVNNGLEAHEDYTLVGWAGRGRFDDAMRPKHMTDQSGVSDDADANKQFWRWVPAAQNDFAARMDWTIHNTFAGANHAPVARVNGSLVRNAAPGSTVTLDATGTTDPDGNALTYSWWQYADVDSAAARLTINNSTSATGANFVVPNETGRQIHVILEVTDNGSPRLVGYRRVIINIGSGGPPPPPPPPPPSGGVIQAEVAALSGGVLIESNQAGFNGTGFLNFPTTGGAAQFDGISGGTAAVLRPSRFASRTGRPPEHARACCG